MIKMNWFEKLRTIISSWFIRNKCPEPYIVFTDGFLVFLYEDIVKVNPKMKLGTILDQMMEMRKWCLENNCSFYPIQTYDDFDKDPKFDKYCMNVKLMGFDGLVVGQED